MLVRCGLKPGATPEQKRTYIDRGIGVDPKWVVDYRAFETWAFANGWKRGLQLDRIDNSGPYADWNCRFVTRKENARNKRNTLRLANGMPLAEYYDRFKSESSPSYKNFRARVKLGWSLYEALQTPQREKRTLCAANGMSLAEYYEKFKNESSPSYINFRARVKLGWSLEEALHTPLGERRRKNNEKSV